LEIISGVERRRRWRVEEKLRIVAEVEQPGASILEVARRHDLSRGLLWNWRQQVHRGRLTAAAEPQFLALHVVPEPRAPLELDRPEVPSHDKRSNVHDGTIEILLPDGVTVRITMQRNKVHHVHTAERVARLLGVEVELIHDLTLGLEPEDGVIWAYGMDDDGVLAFTDDGIGRNLYGAFGVKRILEGHHLSRPKPRGGSIAPTNLKV
jgi:transposase